MWEADGLPQIGSRIWSSALRRMSTTPRLSLPFNHVFMFVSDLVQRELLCLMMGIESFLDS